MQIMTSYVVKLPMHPLRFNSIQFNSKPFYNGRCTAKVVMLIALPSLKSKGVPQPFLFLSLLSYPMEKFVLQKWVKIVLPLLPFSPSLSFPKSKCPNGRMISPSVW